MAAVESGVPKVVAALGSDDLAGRAAADAILTTDTVRKEALVVAELAGGPALTVGGMAKGAAMLAPAMATMLAVLVTDADAAPAALHAALEHAVRDTFNALVVDACTSTNDTVLLLANGAAGNERIGPEGHGFHALVEAVTEACDELARAMASDAEGATKLVSDRGARRPLDRRCAPGRSCRRIEPARAVLALRAGPVLGAHPVGARRKRHLVRPGARRDRVQRHHRVPRRASPRCTTRPRSPRR